MAYQQCDGCDNIMRRPPEVYGICQGIVCTPGYNRLWAWFGLSRASWLTIPRVLLHEMPQEWQEKMAALLEEMDGVFHFPDDPTDKIIVQRKSDGKFASWPDWVNRYRNPDMDEINKRKAAPQEGGEP